MLEVSVDISGWKALLRETTERLKDAEAWIKNAVAYVVFLEHGSSRQSPHGMVRVSVPEIREALVRELERIPFGAVARDGRLQQAIDAAVDGATAFGRTLIRSRTPIRTGWARLNWVVVNTAGQEIPGPPLGGDELTTIAGRGEGGRAFF